MLGMLRKPTAKPGIGQGQLAFFTKATCLLLPLMAFGAVLFSPTTADARIKCRGDMQIVNGQPIATPYCEDQYLAKVARQYGTRTSAARIRNNPNHKKEVCRLVRHDIRVQEACRRILPSPHNVR